ncbi:RING-type domain-containing protein [Mycena chlorophos]|uniref:RING-type domain-containing protein n=1 Tax=Mycena chlorophos TaxID=658473 RepID=A0A8H6WFU7_MYCCL|nr:RING-type domain-containing protein [Mycena chlorophos]
MGLKAVQWPAWARRGGGGMRWLARGRKVVVEDKSGCDTRFKNSGSLCPASIRPRSMTTRAAVPSVSSTGPSSNPVSPSFNAVTFSAATTSAHGYATYAAVVPLAEQSSSTSAPRHEIEEEEEDSFVFTSDGFTDAESNADEVDMEDDSEWDRSSMADTGPEDEDTDGEDQLASDAFAEMVDVPTGTDDQEVELDDSQSSDDQELK